MFSYSEGSRGLSVPLRVSGIFTATTISPSSWLRQCPDRYTIRAGRNLPDKEFRYNTKQMQHVLGDVIEHIVKKLDHLLYLAVRTINKNTVVNSRNKKRLKSTSFASPQKADTSY